MAVIEDRGEKFEVKPCPFCGSDPKEIVHCHCPLLCEDGHRDEARSVRCGRSFGCIHLGPIRDSAKAAVEAWNERH